MTPGGVVQRVTNDPPKTEYLLHDTDPPKWTDKSGEAFFFALYEGKGSACERAEALRKATGEHIFPAVRQKSMPFRVVPDPVSSEEIAVAREQDRPLNSPARRRHKKRPPTPPAPVRTVSDAERFWWKRDAMA